MRTNLTPSDVVEVLRLQAWERAKGELMAMLGAYYRDHGRPESGEKWDRMYRRVGEFIENFEGDFL